MANIGVSVKQASEALSKFASAAGKAMEKAEEANPGFMQECLEDEPVECNFFDITSLGACDGTRWYCATHKHDWLASHLRPTSCPMSDRPEAAKPSEQPKHRSRRIYIEKENE